ncbi:MAG: UPF0158 family protein [Rhodopila sp.]|nr:UPF0158 family protein [Rhodopila sp.]
MTALSKPVSVRFAELLEAFEFANFAHSECHAYVCLDTGRVYFVSGQEDLDEDVPDDIEESDDYLAIPDKRDLDLGNRLAFSFARQEIPDDYDTVLDIFRRTGAYGQFKELLHSHGMLDKWYDFEAEATEKALRAWCLANGIELRED